MSSRFYEFQDQIRHLKRWTTGNYSGQVNLKEIEESFERFREEFLAEETQRRETASQIVSEVTSESFQTLRKLQEIVERLKQENLELKEQVRNLDTTINEFIDRLILGEVAGKVDKGISELVLSPRVGEGHYIESIKDMQSALRGDEHFADIFQNERQRLDCQQAWDLLKTDLECNPKLFRLMKILKKYGTKIAHPRVDRETVYAAMKTHIRPSDRETFEKLFQIYQKLQDRQA